MIKNFKIFKDVMIVLENQINASLWISLCWIQFVLLLIVICLLRKKTALFQLILKMWTFLESCNVSKKTRVNKFTCMFKNIYIFIWVFFYYLCCFLIISSICIYFFIINVYVQKYFFFFKEILWFSFPCLGFRSIYKAWCRWKFWYSRRKRDSK